jgi:fructose-1-phosphate kinase PfkB-like protein
MAKRTPMRPHAVRVNRSDLRQKQRETLNQAKQNTVVVISASDPQDEKLLVDKKYFDELVQRMHSLVETLEIMADQKLFAQILSAAPSLREDAKRGKLHSFEEVFKNG